MKFIVTTHGETNENIDAILQGQLPGILSPRGVGQSEKVALYLKDRQIDYIDTSCMGRCVNTREIVSRYHPNAKVKKNPYLNARSLGNFEGMKKDKATWNNLEGEFFTNRPTGGETLEETWKRLSIAYSEARERPEESTTLFIAHGETVILLGGIILGYDLPTAYKRVPEPKKAEISEYEIDVKGLAKIIKTNFGEHLL